MLSAKAGQTMILISLARVRVVWRALLGTSTTRNLVHQNHIKIYESSTHCTQPQDNEKSLLFNYRKLAILHNNFIYYQ